MQKLIIVTGVLYSELCYIEEWINFYLSQGVSYIYIYVMYKDNKSNNQLFFNYNLKYKNNSRIKLIHINFYNYCVIKDFVKNYNKYYNNNYWVSFLDIDEFLYSPLKNNKLIHLIEYYEFKKIYAVSVNWLCFGSNDLINKPNSVLKSFTKCCDKYNSMNYPTKILVKCSIIDTVQINKLNNSHKIPIKKNYNYFNSLGKILNKSTNVFRFAPQKNPLLLINHYIIKSKNEYLNKINNNPNRHDRYNINQFNKYNNFLNKNTNTDILSK